MSSSYQTFDTTKDLKEPLLASNDQSLISSKSKSQKKLSKVAQFFTKYYLFGGAMAGIFFGLQNYLLYLAVDGAMEMRLAYLIPSMNFVFFIVYHAYFAIQLKMSKGVFWSSEDSLYYNNEKKFDLKLALIVIGRSLNQILSTLILYYIFETSILSGINSSIIFSIYGATSVMTAIAFYFIFKETLGQKHVAGIMIVMISVVLMANGKYIPTQEAAVKHSITADNQISVLVPIALALTNCFIFVLNSAAARFLRGTKMNTYQYTADSQSIVSTLYVSIAIYQHIYISPYSLREFYLVTSGSLMYLIGVLCFNGALTYGKGGSSQAIIQVQAPFQLILEIVFLQIYPALLGLIGMVVCIIGALVLILTKH
ncbi:UNKNOWN [Stylonychia lemnae]|uniref:EamA domain-containing protein n=1 Tax=Stylonychia lemnae TaxID=5949 RepID=A0A078A8J7_STYLE|nr:UNKNOWN [Stylonychia lemnae]|eukprot:CDW78595.1 UNKNOWN [Stylonychia lemnae]